MISHFQVSCNLGDFGDWESDCFCPGQGNWFIFYKTRNQDLTICCSAMKKENHGRKKNKGKRERESQSISLPFSPLSFTFSLLCCKHLEVWSMSQKLWHICAVSWLWEPVGNAYYAHILYIFSFISTHSIFGWTETRPNWARKVCDMNMSTISSPWVALAGKNKMALKKKGFLLRTTTKSSRT